jgi:hypothetical protein
MSRKYIILVLALLIVGGERVWGQENFQSTVNVTKEYEGKLGQISKSPFSTVYSDTLLKLNLNFDYSTFDRPYKDLYEFSPVQGVQLQNRGEAVYPVLLFRGSLAYPWMPEADLFLQPRLNGKNSFGVYAKHNSFWGQDQIGEAVDRSVTNAGFFYGFNWKKGEMRLGGGYRHTLHGNYLAGTDPFQVNAALANLKIRSLDGRDSRFFYSLEMDYAYTSAKIPDVVENYVDGRLEIGGVLKKNHIVKLMGRLENSVGNDMILAVEPEYSFKNGRFNASVGVGVSAVMGDKVLVYPHGNLSYEVVRGNLWLQAHMDGGNELWDYGQIQQINPWAIYFHGTDYVSIPFSAEVGIKGAVKDVFGYMLKGGYVRYANYLMFSEYNSKMYLFGEQDVDELRVEAGMTVKTDFLDVSVKGLYRDFGQSKINMIPAFRLDASVVYNYMKRMYLGANVRYSSSMYDNLNIYDAFVDLGVEFTYVVNPKLSLFAKGRNLLNNPIYYVQEYVEPGANFGLGLFIKL